ncbi:TonB-dependent receptor [Bacteroides gallinaceum]|uniref:TonB-dependent receptor n=1 Tax=Bacteroides gallinaceum TaxID=1462571 RepID=A0ABT7VD97_9BACE|nr:TonB-dependent receptor [Bacteroides gallinaceum]MDM8324261.1 TonB-dependent receptor [Bacteroides gallinaceum]
MKKHKILTGLMLASASAAAATNNNANGTLPGDTTKVIDIEEVVVIATPKENSRLRQQPVSATSLSQEDMRNNAVTSVKSLSALVPNLFIPDYGSKLTTSVYIRGIGSRINTPAIGLYVDNIPFIDKSAFDFNYADVERIDVMRGPQGTLYGRNTMGGLIRVFTKSPFTYQGTDLRLSAATYNNYQASLTHYHRISTQFAFSAGAFYSHKGGFFKNDFNGKRIDTDNEFGGRIRAIWLPTENLKLDFTVNYEYTNQGGYPYEYTGRTDGETEDRAGYIGSISYNNDCGYRRNLVNSGVNLEYQGRNFTLSSATGFQYLYDRMDLDQDFTEQDIYTIMQKQNSKTLSEEIVMKSKPGSRWQWTTGVSGFYQWLDTDAPVTFRPDGVKTMIEDNANSMFPSGNPAAPTMHLTVNNSTLPVPGRFETPVLNGAVYHQSTLNDLFVDGLSLTVGLRLDYEKIKMHYDSGTDMDFDFLFGMGPMHITSENLHAISSFIGEESADYTQLLPKFALEYAWNPQNNVYASVTKGYRSGGYNIQMFSDLIQGSLRNAMIDALAADPNFKRFASMLENFKTGSASIREATLYKPEYSWNYEIGTHLTLFGGKLQADLAAFYMDTRDQQISRFADSGLGRITVNAGKSRSIGAEASLRSQITDALSLYGSYGYTYATFTDYTLSDTEDYNGNYVPFVPKHTFTAGGQYVFRLRKGAWLDNITVNANYRAAGRIYWTEQNNASQPLYGILNGRVSLNKGNGQVGFWINNALNKDYQAFYFETMNRGFAQQGRPLQFGIDLKCRF